MPHVQVGDVKLYLMKGRQVLCKTQVPVWDIPVITPIEKPSEDAQEQHYEGGVADVADVADVAGNVQREDGDKTDVVEEEEKEETVANQQSSYCESDDSAEANTNTW